MKRTQIPSGNLEDIDNILYSDEEEVEEVKPIKEKWKTGSIGSIRMFENGAVTNIDDIRRTN